MFELVFMHPEGQFHLFINTALVNNFSVLVEIADQFIIGNMRAQVAFLVIEGNMPADYLFKESDIKPADR
jgi:hypothetical protein